MYPSLRPPTPFPPRSNHPSPPAYHPQRLSLPLPQLHRRQYSVARTFQEPHRDEVRKVAFHDVQGDAAAVEGVPSRAIVGVKDGGGVGVVKFGGFGTGGKVGGDKVVERQPGGGEICQFLLGEMVGWRDPLQGVLGFFIGIAASDVAFKGCAPGDVVHLLMSELVDIYRNPGGQNERAFTFGTW